MSSEHEPVTEAPAPIGQSPTAPLGGSPARPAIVPPSRPAMVGPTIRPPAPSVMLAPRRAVATLALFVAGLAIGVAGYGVVNAAPPLPTYPPLASAPEPQIAHDLAAAIVAGDAKGIADHLQPDAADALSTALKPIVEVTSMEYLGTVEQDGKDLAGYVIHGRDQNKAKQVVGVVVDVSGGTIVAINQ